MPLPPLSAWAEVRACAASSSLSAPSSYADGASSSAPLAACEQLLIAASGGAGAGADGGWRLATLATEAPEGVDVGAWQAEHLRLATSLLGELLVRLAAPCGGGAAACDARSCPSMHVGEQVFLCAAHSAPRACCAADYTAHTVDAAQALLAAAWAFPSRATVRTAAAAPHFANLARRLYRPLAHAARHHADIFNAFEADTRCAGRLEALARRYSLLPVEALTIGVPAREGDADARAPAERGLSLAD